MIKYFCFNFVSTIKNNHKRILLKSILFIYTLIYTLYALNYNVNTRIINGNNVLQQNPYWKNIVSLRVKGKHFCSGTYIGNKWVLTAAHCITESSSSMDTNSSYKVYTNHYDLTKQTAYGIVKTIVHEQYSNATNQNDIALIRLDSEIADTSDILLPINSEDLLPGTQSWVAGWGTTDPNQIILPNILQESSVPLIDKTQCLNSYSIFFGDNAITDNMLCAGYMSGGTDSCQGDSGGPLIIKEGSKSKLIGIVSWGAGCAEPQFPGVYTSIKNYIQWIKKKTALNPDVNKYSELVVQDSSTGYIFKWRIDQNFHKLSKHWGTNPNGTLWNNIHLSDIDHDGIDEYIIQHAVKGYVKGIDVNVTNMKNTEYWIGSVGDKQWKLIDVKDLNSDGHPDCIFQHPLGYIMVWEMKGMKKIKQHWLGK